MNKYFIVIIFALAILLRLGLTIVNRQANDDHVEVIKLLLQRPVIKEDCWECFQPKLYYYMCIFFVRLFSIYSTDGITLIAQSVSLAAGILTLILIWIFLNKLTFKDSSKSLTFAFIALNPSLIAINAQATNDSLLIFFGTLAIYSVKFIAKKGFFYPAVLTLSCCLAVLTKGSGFVIFIASFLNILILTFKKNYWFTILLLLFTCIFSIFITFFGPYLAYYQKYGSPFIINADKDPVPNLFERTYVNRPGITSIADGYFTFHYLNLLEQPYLTHYKLDYPLHRTSLWSVLYGRFYSAHFDRWPPTWSNSSDFVINLTKLIFIFGLPSFLIIIFGYLITFLNLFKKISKEHLVLVIFLTLFLMMVILYTYTYRDFSTMKSIFIYPAILAIAIFFGIGLEFIMKAFNNKLFKYVFYSHLIFLYFLFIGDIIILIYDLAIKSF